MKVKGKITKVLYLKNNTGLIIYQFETEYQELIKVYSNKKKMLYATFTYELTLNKKENYYELENAELNLLWEKEDVYNFLAFYYIPTETIKHLYRVHGNETIEILKHGKAEDFILSFKKEDDIQVFTDLIATLNALRVPLIEYAKIIGLKMQKKATIEYNKRYKKERSFEFVLNNFYDVLGECNTSYSTLEKASTRLGINLESLSRLKATIFQAILDGSNMGNCYFHLKDIVKSLNTLYGKREKSSALLKEETSGNTRIRTFQNTFYLENLIDLKTDLKKGINRYYRNFFVFNLKDVKEALYSLKDEEKIIIENIKGSEVYYLKKIYEEEMYVAKKIIQLDNSKTKYKKDEDFEDHKKQVEELLESWEIYLEDKQLEFVLKMSYMKGGVFYLNGGAGRGKTFTISVFLKVLKHLNRLNIVSMFAPTGRAAKRMNEMVNDLSDLSKSLMPAQTIHQQTHDMENSNNIVADIVLVDESSMVDIELMSNLLKLIPENTQLIFVGHDRQLESVAAGRVFADLIDSRVIEGIELEVSKRFKQNSSIYRNSENVLNYNMVDSHSLDTESYLYLSEKSEDLLNHFLEKYREVIAENKKCQDVQVLIPQIQGVIGVKFINYLLQKEWIDITTQKTKTFFENEGGTVYLNREKIDYQLKYLLGDKILNKKNNKGMIRYIRNRSDELVKVDDFGFVANGEIGIVDSYKLIVNDESGESEYVMVVKFEEYYYYYNKEMTAKSLDHAYATTVHKSQGSEWPITFFLVDRSHQYFLKNNLVYTGITRAKDFCYTIASKEALLAGIQKKTKYEENGSNLYVRKTNLLNQLRIHYFKNKEALRIEKERVEKFEKAKKMEAQLMKEKEEEMKSFLIKNKEREEREEKIKKNQQESSIRKYVDELFV